MTRRKYKTALTIAGSDTSCGAGIQADLKTFAALDCYGMSVITALTAQNTTGVKSVYEIPVRFIAKQIDALFEDIDIDAVKIGMVQNEEIIKTISRRLRFHNARNIVVDPVMIAKGGKRLLRTSAIEALKSELFPLVAIITPNIPEAVLLTGRKIENTDDIERAAVELLSYGSKSVLIKGGHAKTKLCRDCLCISGANGRNEIIWFEGKRIRTKNTHGTGCTLSSAIASYLAKGYHCHDAVKKSKEYITSALEAGASFKLGHGFGPLNHFYKMSTIEKRR